jgi:hypothetical protein
MKQPRRILLAAVAASIPVVVLLYALLTRPAVQANRFCRDAGFGSLPPSARDLHIERRGPPFTTQSLYLRFQATAAEAKSFFHRSGIDPNDPNQEPGPMQIIRFGPKAPPWMHWSDPIHGRIYNLRRRNASVWLAIDDDSHTVYMAMHESRPPWLRRLLERLGLG